MSNNIDWFDEEAVRNRAGNAYLAGDIADHIAASGDRLNLLAVVDRLRASLLEVRTNSNSWKEAALSDEEGWPDCDGDTHRPWCRNAGDDSHLVPYEFLDSATSSNRNVKLVNEATYFRTQIAELEAERDAMADVVDAAKDLHERGERGTVPMRFPLIGEALRALDEAGET